MRIRPRARCAAAAAAMIAAATVTHASAQDLLSRNYIKPGDEVLTLSLGGIVNEFQTGVSVDGTGSRGTTIDLEGNGLKKHLSSFQAVGTWRFLPRHRIDLEWFSAERSGSQSYARDITIGDNAYPIGATVSARARSQFFLADYRYSFVKTDSLELAGALGLYGGRFEFDLDATGNEQPLPRSSNRSVSTTVPLPLIGATLDWYASPQWKVFAGVQGMKANIGDVDGSVLVAAVGTEYMLVRNFGVGARYMYSDISVDVSRSSFSGHVDWTMNSVSLYAKFAF